MQRAAWLGLQPHAGAVAQLKAPAVPAGARSVHKGLPLVVRDALFGIEPGRSAPCPQGTSSGRARCSSWHRRRAIAHRVRSYGVAAFCDNQCEHRKQAPRRHRPPRSNESLHYAKRRPTLVRTRCVHPSAAPSVVAERATTPARPAPLYNGILLPHHDACEMMRVMPCVPPLPLTPMWKCC